MSYTVRLMEIILMPAQDDAGDLPRRSSAAESGVRSAVQTYMYMGCPSRDQYAQWRNWLHRKILPARSAAHR